MSPHRLEHDWFDRDLPEAVTVGPGSWLFSSYMFLHDQSARGVAIGRDSGLYRGTFFELGPHARVEIGDFCSIVAAIIRTNGRLRIGDHALVAHETIISDRPMALPPDLSPWDESESAEIVIGPNVWVGTRAVIVGGLEIGENSIVAAAAVVTESVPPNVVVAGNPARVVKRIA